MIPIPLPHTSPYSLGLLPPAEPEPPRALFAPRRSMSRSTTDQNTERHQVHGLGRVPTSGRASPQVRYSLRASARPRLAVHRGAHGDEVRCVSEFGCCHHGVSERLTVTRATMSVRVHGRMTAIGSYNRPSRSDTLPDVCAFRPRSGTIVLHRRSWRS